MPRTKKSKQRRRTLELLENRQCLSAVGFSEHVFAESEAKNTRYAEAVDIDNDGDKDLLTGSDGKIAWHENLDGTGEFGPQNVIASDFTPFIELADVDGDGDQDIVAATASGKACAPLSTQPGDPGIPDACDSEELLVGWYENVGDAEFGGFRLIGTGVGRGLIPSLQLATGDIDGDGDVDIATLESRNSGDLVWYSNDGNGEFSTAVAVGQTQRSASDLVVADANGDGQLDFFYSATRSDNVSLILNLGVDGVAETRLISADALPAHAIELGDLDGDGDVDVIAVDRIKDEATLYVNSDGLGTYEIRETDPKIAASSLRFADVDSDDDPDLLLYRQLSFNSFQLERLEDVQAAGDIAGFEKLLGFDTDALTTSVGDFNGDGMMDIVTGHADEISVLLAAGDTYQQTQVPLQQGPKDVTVVATADIDNDGDLDIVAGSSGDGLVSWFENTQSEDGFVTHVAADIGFQTGSDIGSVLSTIDIDGDGDLDILAVGNSGGYLLENVDGLGSFAEPRLIEAKARSLAAGDFDGDGDADILSINLTDAVWYTNLDGMGSFGEALPAITSLPNGGKSVELADVDNDGDLDAVFTLTERDTVSWVPNIGGQEIFGEMQTIGTGVLAAHAARLGDVNGDGTLDVVVTSYWDSQVSWFANDGAGGFGGRNTIATGVTDARGLEIGDLDGDGDLDVLATSNINGTVQWYENEDGAGAFGNQRLLSGSSSRPYSLAVGDLDNDGDLDVVSAARGNDSITWYESDLAKPATVLAGDVNDDGAVDFNDFLILSLNFGEDGGRSEGDLNGSGKVDFEDFLILSENFGKTATAAIDHVFADASL